jgi:hypothetical protein
MAGFKNWKKVYESDGIYEFANTVTGVLTVVEGDPDDRQSTWEAYVRHPNEAVDELVAENLGDGVLGSREAARDAARDYRDSNSFEEYRTRHKAASSALNSMATDSIIEKDDVELMVHSDSVLVSVNTKAFLENYLEIDEECIMFQGMLNLLQDRTNMSGYDAIQKMTGEGVEYTYNSEVVIHPDFQYCLFQMTPDGEMVDVNEIYDYEYIAVQIHKGTESAMRGFSSWKIFTLSGRYTFGEFFSAIHDVTATAASDRRWYSDDAGYNWYSDTKDTPSFDYDEMSEYWRFDPENDKVYDRETGEEITFGSSALMG